MIRPVIMCEANRFHVDAESHASWVYRSTLETTEPTDSIRSHQSSMLQLRIPPGGYRWRSNSTSSSGTDSSDGGVKIGTSAAFYPPYPNHRRINTGGSTGDSERSMWDFQQPVPFLRAISLPARRVCCNCAAFHGPVDGQWFLDCLTVSVRIKGTNDQDSIPGAPKFMLLPNSRSERSILGEQIWTAFERMKIDNEVLRSRIKGAKKRDVAPVPWLKWTGRLGTSGQTRNKENFRCWWIENVVGEENGIQNGTMAYLLIRFDLDAARMQSGSKRR